MSMVKSKKKIPPKKAGRPSKVKAIDLDQLKFLVEKGCTDEEICGFFKIDRSNFFRHQQSNPAFRNTIQSWKEFADDRVERSLYESACGYSHPSEEIFCAFGKVTRVKTIKHYAPNALSCAIWLKNRKPDQWRDKVPDPADNELKDKELVFMDVPNQKTDSNTKRFDKFLNQN